MGPTQQGLCIVILLCTFTFVAGLSQFIKIGGIDFSNMGMPFNRSVSHSTSLPAKSKATNLASIVDLIIIVCLVDFQETNPPLRVWILFPLN